MFLFRKRMGYLLQVAALQTEHILAILLLCALPLHAANTYYISSSTGSDSNTSAQAQSKSTPWAHLPGMASCIGNCGSYTPQAGDTFVLMGCDVWVNSDLPVLWNWSGSSGSLITIGGEDQTWYNTTNCPSAWNRPIFDAQKSATSGNVLFSPCASNGCSYVTLDSIEMKGFYLGTSGNGEYIANVGYGNTNWSYTNLYIHGWNVIIDNGGNCVIFGSNYGGSSNILYQYNIVDGSDRTGMGSPGNTTGGTCDTWYTSQQGAKMLSNVVHDVVNGWLPTTGSEFGGNLVYNVLTTNYVNHCNAIETLGGGTYYIHDNVIHNENGGCAGGETMMIGNGSETDYVWNNVIYNLTNSTGTMAPPIAPQGPSSGNSIYMWNNTIVVPVGQTNACLAWSGQGSGTIFSTINMQNNHCITSGSYALDPSLANYTTTTVNNTNLVQTPKQADADSSPHFDEYTSSETYAYSPVASTNSTVGAGTNLASSWVSGFSTNDTSYGCTYDSSVQTVSCPARAANTRPQSAPWDIGAYEFNAQDPPPNPPTGLTATVN